MNFEGLSEKLNGFNRYYENDLKPTLAALEAKRKKAFSNLVIAGTVVAAIIVALLVLAENEDLAIVAGLVGLCVLGYFFYKLSDAIHGAKLSVLPVVCNFLEFDYSSSPRVNLLGRFRHLSLLPSYDEEKREDEISGSLQEVQFWLQEVKLIDVDHDEDGESRTTVFRGLICYFDFHKNFSGTTIGRKDYTALGNLFTDVFTKGERVKLEDPDFERNFQVFSNDQVEARYLLSPRFMERMLRLIRVSNVNDIQFAFDSGKLYLTLESSKKFFEGGGNKLDSRAYVQNIINDVGLIFDVVKTLNLTQETKV